MAVTNFQEALNALDTLDAEQIKLVSYVKAFEGANQILLRMLRHQGTLIGNPIAAEHIAFIRGLCRNGTTKVADWELSVSEESRELLTYGLLRYDEWKQAGMPAKHEAMDIQAALLKALPCIASYEEISQFGWFKERFPWFIHNSVRMVLSPPSA